MAKSWDVVRNLGWGDVAVSVVGDATAIGDEPEGGVCRGDLIDGAVSTWVRPTRPDADGRIVVQRGPTAVASQPEAVRLILDVEPLPSDPTAIPWAAVASSIVAGAVVALIFSPLFAVLAAVSALGLIGRSLGSRWTHRRAMSRRSADLVIAADRIADAASAWAVAEAGRRRAVVDDPDALVDPLVAGGYPWQELDAAELTVSIGRGTQEATPLLEFGTDDPAVVELVPEAVALRDVPIAVTVSAGMGLAITGDRGPAMAVMRWAVLEQVVRHGPASLPVFLITTADRLVEWDWAKWLPSLAGVGVGCEETDELLAEVTGSDVGGLLIVDGVEPTRAGGLAEALAGIDTAHRLLWIGSSTLVPAACGVTVDATADGGARLRSGGTLSGGAVDLIKAAWTLSLDDALGWARGLAPFVDPLAADGATALPHRFGIGDLGTPHFETGWQDARPDRLVADVGMGAGGVVSLDLVAEGPHALVAGTTGSGKSEFLRTLVTSLALRQPPELLSFVLVDFKGGGAFDPVSGLPHVAAVVTDLDADEAARALTSMRAELTDRERTLRRLGVSDVSDLERAAAVEIPRLVLIVDEFATLADELPDFLDGLVDIARRGRSLGVHLVLATQRPAGVVTGQIRANTNLRVCLRVQDRNDSIDVIDQPDGARLPAIPGRALLAIGAERLAQVQVASVSETQVDQRFEPFVLHPAIFAEDPVFAATYANTVAELNAGHACEAVDDGAETSVDTIAAAMSASTAVRAGAPWLEPLTAVAIDDVAVAMHEAADHAPGDLPFGLLDDPEHRRRLPLIWPSAESGLLILGSDRASVEHSIRLAVVGLLEQRRSVYVFDGLGGLDDLNSFVGVGDVLSPREPERALKGLGVLARAVRNGGEPPAIVVRGWASVADGVAAAGGAEAAVELERLVREGLAAGAPIVVTGASDRDVPGRVRSRLATRLLHNLADPSSYAMFGLRGAPNLGAPLSVVDPDTGLIGMVADLSRSRLERVRRLRPAGGVPSPIRTLGPTVSLADLPEVVTNGSTHRLAVGLDEDLEVRSVEVRPGRPLVVLGEGSEPHGAVVDRIEARLAASDPLVVSNADLVGRDEGVALVAQAATEGRPLVIAASPRSAKGFDSWIGKLLSDATVMLVNPTSRDGEICRVVIPDLRDAPVGRSVIVDRGRVAVVQLAA